MFYFIKNEADVKKLLEIAGIQSRVKQVKLEEELGEQSFPYDTRELFEPIAKAPKNRNEELNKETKSKAKTNEAWSQLIVSFLNPSVQLAFDWEITSSGSVDELVELLTMKNTSHFTFTNDKISELSHFKTVTGVSLKIENKTVPFKMPFTLDMN